MRRILILPFILIVRTYQVILAPHMGHSCRFQPTCSHYMIEALEEHGLKGLWLGIKRILRCNPLGGFGYDGVKKQVKGSDPWV